MKTKNILYALGGFAIAVLIFRACESEPKIKIETKTITKIVTDTLRLKEIVEIEKPVYVERIKTLKGKDSIIYKDEPSETTITAKQFETKLDSNDAQAELIITSTGEVLDVQGVITYPKTETVTTITKIKDKGGVYLYGSIPINNFTTPEVGLMFQVRNKFGVMAGVQYNSLTNKPEIKAGILIKIF